MKKDLRYCIDRVKYKNVDELKYFVLNGWCFSKKGACITYSAMINDEISEVDIVPIKRVDVYKKYKEEFQELDYMSGFRIQVFSLIDEIQSFKLIATTSEGVQEVLYSATSSDLDLIEDRYHIEYAVDSFDLNEDTNIATASGWVYSIDGKDVNIEILDDLGNKIDYSKQINMRTDLVIMHMVASDQKYCGFRIYFNFDENRNYSIRFIREDEVVIDKLKLRDSSTLKLLLNSLNRTNFKRGLIYIKNNGMKQFINRLAGHVDDNENHYQDWFLSHRINKNQMSLQKNIIFKYNPKISIIVATFNTPIEYLKEMIDTVVNQTYTNWELCIADGSSNDSVEKYVQNHYSMGDKIRFTKLDDNYGISGNMNKALELATGDYVGLYDHDDMLELDALFEVVSALQDFRYDIVYTDEDKFDDDKKEYVDPNFKPDYSPDLFRSHNYITHFFCVNMRIIEKVGAMRSDFDGSQDYDFMFRCIEQANGVYHVPKILYHWRMHPLSTAQNPESKMYCYEAGKRAIEEHYKRTGVDAKVEMMPKPMFGMYHTTYSTKDDPLVSILIPNMNHKDILKTCIDSLYKINEYKNFEIVIVENNSTEDSIFEYYEELVNIHSNIKVVTWKGEFNYSAINNFGVKYCSGDYILLLNNDTEMITKDALSEMLGCCMRDEVGAVGAKLLYADDTVQHAGVVIGFGGYAGHINNGIDKDDYGYMVRARISGNYSAVTAACMMVKKSVFEEVNGFDEQFKVACNDVDLCLKIRKSGYLIVFDAFSLWHHYESKSRGYEDNQEKIWRFNSEVEKFQQKWSDILNDGDPYYNKNFKIELGPFMLE